MIFLAVAASLGAARADAMPEPIRVLVMQVRSLFSSAYVDEEILYGENQATDFPKEIQTVYEPSVVLDGYEVSERILHSKVSQIYYVNENQQEYSYKQMTIDFWSGYDNEVESYNSIEINGCKGIVFMKNNQYHLQWQCNGYVFELEGYQDTDMFKELAASVKPVED